MEIKIIRNQKQYEVYLKRLKNIFDAQKGSPELEEFDLLSMVLEKYEEENFPIENCHPLDAIRFMMAQNEIDESRLAQF
ncbi:hypothetical protein MTsPCn5_17160 [Croceitalea sp. MTPC5]|uniref:helix-turn-helix domain-containing protein n=1 Tax=Croceitalea sp. MTPC5 TaxID=3056565 RepID=UPI002B3A0A16|nr:hypothetical protein MTsPCn5_17160 [Croceitalea sp. MTPC5]